MHKIKYLVFDIESVADAELIAKVHYSGQEMEPQDALRKYRDELMEKNGTDFVPYTFQIPVSVAIVKITEDLRIDGLAVLGKPELEPHEICEKFWAGWIHYGKPTFVTFNGRGFDIPLMELAAFRYGIPVPEWFMLHSKSFDQPRSRYNTRSHLDLCDLLTNYGASRFNGGLNLAASILGKPGKMDVQGKMVQDMYNEKKYKEINDYCCCDVLDTYFVFLRTAVLTGKITLHQEQELVQETKAWLEKEMEENPQNTAYAIYLENWGDWKNPWLNVEK